MVEFNSFNSTGTEFATIIKKERADKEEIGHYNKKKREGVKLNTQSKSFVSGEKPSKINNYLHISDSWKDEGQDIVQEKGFIKRISVGKTAANVLLQLTGKAGRDAKG